MIPSLTIERLSSSVMAVPPLCRKADYTLNEAENSKLIRHIEGGGVKTLLYLKNDGYIEVEEIASLADSRVISGIKYAIVREDPARDPFLKKLCEHVDQRLIVSGLGEQPAIVHMRDFGLPGFTAGVVCVAPRLTAEMLRAIRAGDWSKAERIRLLCKPLEDHRNAINPVRVLHEAVRLAGIANTGPLLPLLSNLDHADHDRVREAAVTLLKANEQISA